MLTYRVLKPRRSCRQFRLCAHQARPTLSQKLHRNTIYLRGISPLEGMQEAGCSEGRKRFTVGLQAEGDGPLDSIGVEAGGHIGEQMAHVWDWKSEALVRKMRSCVCTRREMQMDRDALKPLARAALANKASDTGQKGSK